MKNKVRYKFGQLIEARMTSKGKWRPARVLRTKGRGNDYFVVRQIGKRGSHTTLRVLKMSVV